MKNRFVLHRIAAAFGLLAGCIAVYYFGTMPITLRVAVGPVDSEQMRYLATVSRALQTGREPIRFITTVTAGASASAVALERGEVNLAVVRSDDQTSNAALSITILHRRSIVIIGRTDLGIKAIGDLVGKSVIVPLGGNDSSSALVKRVLAHFGFGAADIKVTEASVEDAEKAFVAKQTDALIMVSPPAGRRLRDLVISLAGQNIPLSFLDLPNAEAIVARFPDLESIEIPAGIFGGLPTRPQEALSSVAMTYELVASRKMSDSRAATLTKSLANVRSQLRRNDGAEFMLEPPPLDKARRYLPHPGVSAQLNDEVETFLETYSDHIWLTLFGFSLMGSSIAAFFAWIGIQPSPQSSGKLRELPALVARIPLASTRIDLDVIQKELDEIVMDSLTDYANRDLKDENTEQAQWLAQVQALIDRQQLRIV